MTSRRAFIRTAGLALLAAPAGAAAQSGSVHQIGFLGGASAPGYANLVDSLRGGLRDRGLVEGKNITIHYRWAEGKYERLAALAGELVRLKVKMIITQGTPAAVAAKQATQTIPIVMAIVGSPVERAASWRATRGPAPTSPARPSSWTRSTRSASSS